MVHAQAREFLDVNIEDFIVAHYRQSLLFSAARGKKKKAKDNQYVVFHTLKRRFKLLEEAEVVFEIVAEVTNLPFEHCDTLYTHSECEAAVLLAVDA